MIKQKEISYSDYKLFEDDDIFIYFLKVFEDTVSNPSKTHGAEIGNTTNKTRACAGK